MGIYIKLNCDVFTLLNIELLDSIFAKNAEHAFTGILAWNLLPVNSIIKCFILLNFSFSRGEITKNSLKSIIFCRKFCSLQRFFVILCSIIKYVINNKKAIKLCDLHYQVPH